MWTVTSGNNIVSKNMQIWYSPGYTCAHLLNGYVWWYLVLIFHGSNPTIRNWTRRNYIVYNYL